MVQEEKAAWRKGLWKMENAIEWKLDIKKKKGLWVKDA